MYKYLILKIPLVSPGYVTVIIYFQLAKSVLFFFFPSRQPGTHSRTGAYTCVHPHLCTYSLVSWALFTLVQVTLLCALVYLHQTPNRGEGKLHTGRLLVTSFPCECFQKWSIWLGKLSYPLRGCHSSNPLWHEMTQSNTFIAFAYYPSCSPAFKHLSQLLLVHHCLQSSNIQHVYSTCLSIWVVSSSFSWGLESGLQDNCSIPLDELLW